RPAAQRVRGAAHQCRFIPGPCGIRRAVSRSRRNPQPRHLHLCRAGAAVRSTQRIVQRLRMRGSTVFLVFVLLCGVAVAAVWRGWIEVPDIWNPWAPLDIKAEPNFLTPYKLSRLQSDPQLCDQALGSSSLRFSHQADSDPSAACPLQNVLRVEGGDVTLSSSFLASCRLAVAYALFDVHTLQPAAQAVFGQKVTRIDHLGSFACRNVYSRAEGRLSQHATANALDIAAFRLA